MKLTLGGNSNQEVSFTFGVLVEEKNVALSIALVLGLQNYFNYAKETSSKR